ncbi:MAG: hypothetical protein K9L74_05515, partial [Candidatus Izimaplasma sp.]|nr:hypothetical protein [Candidatus Izimaplasma bacterium]
MSKATVYLREEKERKDVQIGGKDKVKISKSIKEKWQKILDLTAEIFDVPAALIMHITDSHMEVFLKDNNPNNPYPEDGKDTLLHGLYCETVIGRDHSFEVENALNDENWKDNPDVKLNMISYFGLPIKWSDGSFFGTICVLNDEETSYKDKYKKLLNHFKEFIEDDLYHLELQHTLERKSYRDHLTGIGNRRKFDKELAEAFENYTRYEHPF